MSEINLLLVRHGEASESWGKHPNPGLSELGIRQSASLVDNKMLEFLDSYSFKLIQRFFDSKKRKDFFESKISFYSKFNLTVRSKIYLMTSFSKQFKDVFSGGAIFGGGNGNYIDSSIFHPFYGLETNDAFGLEMSTSRIQSEFNLVDIFQGPGLFPIYFRRLSLLAGLDNIKTDFILQGMK